MRIGHGGKQAERSVWAGCVVLACLAVLSAHGASADETAHRLYDGFTAFVANPDGRDFKVTLVVRDINQRPGAPDELLLRIYPPDGRPVVREVIPDDDVATGTYAPHSAGWDHEAWYYATCYSRGLTPTVRWSAFSDPVRLAATPKRTFTYEVKGGQKGVYRVLLVGGPDHYVSLSLDPDLPCGIAGNPEWLHGHGDMFRRSYLFLPKGTARVHALFLQIDQPQTRSFTIKDAGGTVLIQGTARGGLVREAFDAPEPGELDEKVWTLEVSEGPGDFLVNVTAEMAGKARDTETTLENFDQVRPWRGPQAVTAVLAPDEVTARALQGGAIYHDGKLFWQMYQVRLYDYLKTLKAEDFDYPQDLPKRDGYFSVGSHERPRKGQVAWGDVVMHSYSAHKNPKALNFAIRDLFFGMRLIGHGDHVAIGPLRNLAYEMGCYSYFHPRPAWRILRESDAPEEVKGPIREYVTQVCDRLAFCRSGELINGNSLGSLVESLRYCVEATDDAMNKKLFEEYFQRFSSGGFGERIGIGASGGLQESFGYDFHYGSYVLRGWNAVRHDLKDPNFQKVYERMLTLYSYMWSPVGYAPWNSRTSNSTVAGGTYDSWHKDSRFRWKGYGGPDLTESANGANEWFAARRRNYYIVTYHGRLTPTWMGEGFHGQVGLGGGVICQVFIPGKKDGTVIGSKPNGSYGAGMHLSEWRNFHVHGLVGTTTDGKPLVAANSEHFNARLEGNTVTSSGEVRESSVTVTRSYTFEPQAILCSVKLGPSAADNAFGLWGGRPRLRGKVKEAYEMIPYADVSRNRKTGKKGKGATVVSAIAADGSIIGPVTEKPTAAAGVLLDRHGHGARIEFEQTMPVTLGKNDTVLVQLINKTVPAEQIAFTYRIVPYAGEAPAGPVGQAAGEAAAQKMPVIAEADLDGVAKALADQEPRTIKADAKNALVDLRFALAGEHLALLASVKDSKVTQAQTAWKGSCLEVFGSMEGTSAIGQVFLVPAAGDQLAKGHKAAGGIVPAPDIKVTSQATKDGYTMTVLIPLSLLKLDPAKGRIMLEFQITSMGGPKGKVARGTLFGSERAYERNHRYGLFEAPKEGE